MSLAAVPLRALILSMLHGNVVSEDSLCAEELLKAFCSFASFGAREVRHPCPCTLAFPLHCPVGEHPSLTFQCAGPGAYAELWQLYTDPHNSKH